MYILVNQLNIFSNNSQFIEALNSIGTTTQGEIDAYREELLAVYQSDPAAAIAWTLIQNDPTVYKLVTDLMSFSVEDALNKIGQQVSDEADARLKLTTADVDIVGHCADMHEAIDFSTYVFCLVPHWFHLIQIGRWTDLVALSFLFFVFLQQNT